MGIGVGLVLIAVGAVLAFAVDISNNHGFNVNTIGFILMVVGVIGVLLDLLLFMPRRRRSYVEAGAVAPGRRVTRVDEEL
jgi:heme/copper-type cytochrome/quinol oxidase subunit 4